MDAMDRMDTKDPATGERPPASAPRALPVLALLRARHRRAPTTRIAHTCGGHDYASPVGARRCRARVQPTTPETGNAPGFRGILTPSTIARRLAAALLLALAIGCAGTPGPDPEVDPSDPRAGLIAEIGRTREAILRNPEDPALHYRLGNQLFDMGRYGEAAQSYQAAIQRAPDSPDAYTNLGLCLRRLGQFRAAVGAYETSLDLRPGDPATLRNLIAVADVMGDAERGLSARARLVAADPADTQARAELARLYFDRGRYAEAAQVYAKIIEQDPGQADDHFILGRCHYFLEQPALAEAAWRKALDLEPRHPSANRALAVLHWSQRDFERAWQAVERCRELDIPLDPEFLETLRQDAGR